MIVSAVALLANLPGEHPDNLLQDHPLDWLQCAESSMAVGTGFGQLFRGLGNADVVSQI